jgi:GT2 family glycosyltransferase
VPLVSYILVNWHTEDLLPRALSSIAAQDHPLRELIVVDNGSERFGSAALAPYLPLKLIQNTRNLGFAAANNQALAQARGEFVVLLNCDAYLAPDFTRRALHVFAANPRLGTVVPKLLRDDGSGVIDSAGHVMHTDRTTAHRGRGKVDQGQYEQGGFVFGGTAAAIAYRRAMLESAAYAWPRALPPDDEGLPGVAPVFDEAFFSYFEDVDLDWRAALAGWRAYYEPECLAYHRGHASGGRGSYAIRLRAEKNRYLMLAKNDTLGSQLAAAGPLALYEAWHALKALFQPWLWPAAFMLLWHLPGALAYRWRAGRGRIIPPRQVAAQFVPRGLEAPLRSEPPSQRDVPLLERPGERRGGGTQYPLVSVIVLNLNGLELTRQCVRSLLRQTYSPVEIIVVDNGSAVDEAALVGVTFTEVKTLRLRRNHGFAGGVNWGLTLAQGGYIALVNNDCVLDPECLKRLVYAARRTGAPAVSGRLLDLGDPALLLAALAALDLEQEQDEAIIWDMPDKLAAALDESQRNHGLSLSGYIVHDAYGEQQECFYPSGALCLLRRDAVEPLLPELFPHFYFAYHEDAGLGFRLRARGGWVAKEPRAAAVHLHGATARRLGRPRLRFLEERNRCLNLLGFLPGWVILRLLPRWAGECLLTGLALLARPGDWLGWLAAHLWLCTHPGAVLRWRAKCRAQASVPDEAWLAQLSGQVRGRGGLLNWLGLAWCRLLGVPCRETKLEP